jgi:hypothetical protein
VSRRAAEAAARDWMHRHAHLLPVDVPEDTRMVFGQFSGDNGEFSLIDIAEQAIDEHLSWTEMINDVPERSVWD